MSGLTVLHHLPSPIATSICVFELDHTNVKMYRFLNFEKVILQLLITFYNFILYFMGKLGNWKVFFFFRIILILIKFFFSEFNALLGKTATF